MSLVDDVNREENLRRAKENVGSAQEYLVELELKRIENEMYMNPGYAKFWAKRREQVLNLRNLKA